MSYDFDLFVIGGGSGGVRAGRVAAQGGAKVALAEEYRYGGTCVIRGCVPKKLMVYASAFSEAFEAAKGFGWEVGETSFDFKKLIGSIDTELDRLEGLYQKGLESNGVKTFDTRATVKDAHTVVLSNGDEVTAKTILVATGGRPFIPNVNGHEHVMSSDDVFLLKDLPKRILVVGGGYIACEFAGIFNGMGSEVTQFYRGAQILRGFDGEVRGHVAEEMIRKGVNLHLGTDVSSIEKKDDGLHVTCTDGSSAVVDKVLYATGRVANTDDMGLEDVGVKLGRKGEIVVDEFSQTSVPSIYAVGDVTDRVNLTPVAIREGVAFVETVFNDNPTAMDHEMIATAVFTQPEVGTVGLGQEEAGDNYNIEIYRAAFRPMANILAGSDERMLMKLIVDKDSRKVLGCHIVGPAAGEMIQMAAIAIKMGATKEDFDRTVAVHPTAAEELVTMKEPVG
ncbi:glutathione-disulfide reductase [Rhodobacterales bacterium 52_120_T64]|nr:glutathione-disulfide reductase [Rhodobacterales bacterium 52_120_T64]